VSERNSEGRSRQVQTVNPTAEIVPQRKGIVRA
jgi:hypothetical protein